MVGTFWKTEKVQLGDLRTDSKGRLIIVPGDGRYDFDDDKADQKKDFDDISLAQNPRALARTALDPC